MKSRVILRRLARSFRIIAAVIVMLGVCADSSQVMAQVDGCPEPNDEQANACLLKNGVAIQSFIERPGDVDTFTFGVEAGGGLVALELLDLPADYDLYLVDGNGQVFAQGVHEGTTQELVTLAMPSGTYYAMVTADPERTVDVTRPYTLLLLVTAVVGALPPQLAAPMSATENRPILLQDNFDDPQRARLPRTSIIPDRLELAYVDGEFSMRNIGMQRTPWGVRLPDVGGELTVSVDARFIGPTARRYIVFVCRDQPIGGGSTRGAYRFTYFPATREVLLRRGDLGGEATLSPQHVTGAARPDNENNHFELNCIGDTISARINGQPVISVTDATYHGGQSWIVIGGNVDEVPRAEVRLDNLVIYGP